MQCVAFVSTTPEVAFAELAIVAAAIQKQVVRDLGPPWALSATVSPFARIEDVPRDYWLVTIGADAGPGAGVHLDKQGQPYALVEPGEHWSVVASHECLEMLVNPHGDRRMSGLSVKPGQGRVEYLVEVCDPSQDPALGYTIDGVLVSDFFMPAFFDDERRDGVRYSQTGAIVTPREVLPGGYLSWHDPATGHWWQDSFLRETKGPPRDLGVVERAEESARSMIYRTAEAPMHRLPRPGQPEFLAATALVEAARGARGRPVR